MPQLHRKQFLRARCVAITWGGMEQKEGKDTNKSVNEQMKKPLSRVPSNKTFSTFEQLIQRFMEIQVIDRINVGTLNVSLSKGTQGRVK